MVWKFLTTSFPRRCSPLAAGSSVVAVSSVIAVTLIMTVILVLVIASATNALSVMDAPSVMAIAKLMTVTLVMAVASVSAIAFVWAVTSHVIPVAPPSLPTPGDYHMGCSSRSIVSTHVACLTISILFKCWMVLCISLIIGIVTKLAFLQRSAISDQTLRSAILDRF